MKPPNPTFQGRKPFFDMVKYEAKQFCSNTTLHGYRFIILPKRILLERVIWLIIVLVSLTTALVLLFIAWTNFQRNPTILVTDSTHHPIWFYPFPTVSVCSYNKISKRKAFDLAGNLSKVEGLSVEEIAWDLRILTQLIHHDNTEIPKSNYTRLQELLDVNEISVDKALQELAPSCQNILQKCKWKGEEKRCESIFEQVRTSEGFCCVFNYFALKNHNFSGALPRKAPKKPRKLSACGYQTALEVLVNNEPQDYFASHFWSIGHQILISNPFDFPDWTSQTSLLEMRESSWIGLNPTQTLSTDYIKQMAITQRNCLFRNERNLHNFQYYSYHNCMVECRMNLTIKLCGCIPFYFHNPNGTFPVQGRICDLQQLTCLEEKAHLIETSVPGFDFNSINSNHEWGSEKGECDCLPDCDYMDYLAESSSAVLTREYSTNQQNLYGGIVIKNQSVFRLYFNDLVATKNRRDVMFTWHTLLAYYGGLLGLFVGFSFVSVVEVLYFFTIRLFVDVTSSGKPPAEPLGNFQKINVRPLQFQSLDVKNLTVKDKVIDTQIRFRSNSNSWFIN